MQVKKFEAPTMQEALDTIKRELGPEAVILQTKRNKGGFGLLGKVSVEVTAAVADHALAKKANTERRLPAATSEQVKNMSAKNQKNFYNEFNDSRIDKIAAQTADKVSLSQSKLTATRYAEIDPVPMAAAPAPKLPIVAPTRQPAVEQLQQNSQFTQELDDLKQVVAEMKNSANTQSQTQRSETLGTDLTPAVSDAFDFLILSGVDRRLAYGIIKNASFQLDAASKHDRDAVLDQVAQELMQSIEVMDCLEGVTKRADRGDNATPVVMAFVGSSGVGKTSALTKIASIAQNSKNLKVGLIDYKTPDTHRNVIFDELLETYSKILKTPYRKVISKKEIQMALAELAGLDLILIDTAAIGLKDSAQIAEIESALHKIVNVRIQLVLSASTSDAENFELTRRAKDISPEGLIFTKLDDAVKFGTIYNVSERFKLPLQYFSTGAKFPDDIETATPERVVAKIMGLI
ncbi:MAG: hypothetical protein KA715_06470 [Xanthomonadaceae bacterium]|nr:hypothetical protein [Xanthomonadaceae bacterium]